MNKRKSEWLLDEEDSADEGDQTFDADLEYLQQSVKELNEMLNFIKESVEKLNKTQASILEILTRQL